MSKVVYAGLVAVVMGLLIATAACSKHRTKKDGCGSGTGCYAAEGCGEAACGCGGCGETAAACGGCGEAACGCGGCGEAAGGCGEGCGCGGAAEVTEEDARHAMQLYRQYAGWKKTNATPFTSKAHKRHQVYDYANGLAYSIFMTGRGTYPSHSTVAKEGWKDGKLSMVWIMEKLRPGYDRKNGDWFYATVSVQGEVKNAGRVASCIECHESAGNDFVFGLPSGK